MPKPQNERCTGSNRSRRTAPRPADADAGWTSGIRALYDSVAQEPLPAEFIALLVELAKKSEK